MFITAPAQALVRSTIVGQYNKTYTFRVYLVRMNECVNELLFDASPVAGTPDVSLRCLLVPFDNAVVCESRPSAPHCSDVIGTSPPRLVLSCSHDAVSSITHQCPVRLLSSRAGLDWPARRSSGGDSWVELRRTVTLACAVLQCRYTGLYPLCTTLSLHRPCVPSAE